MDFAAWETPVWTRLREEKRPIVLYGMGDGADKILDRFEALGIRAAGVFASDEFVRGHSFRGFRVKKLSETVDELGEDLVIVIAFASQRPEVLEKMYALDARFDVVAPDVPVVPGPVFDAGFARALFAHSLASRRPFFRISRSRFCCWRGSPGSRRSARRSPGRACRPARLYRPRRA